jgi:hypothetical protein
MRHVNDLAYVGRPYRASPCEEYPGAHHLVEQKRIVREAFTEK